MASQSGKEPPGSHNSHSTKLIRYLLIEIDKAYLKPLGLAFDKMEFIQTMNNLPGITTEQQTMIKLRLEKIPEIRLNIEIFANFIQDYVLLLHSIPTRPQESHRLIDCSSR